MNKIMIIEDNIDIMKVLIKEAKKINEKMDIITADCATDAFHLATINNIKAFFIDVQLKNSDGIELAKRIRELFKYEFVPIVFITAVPTRELEAFRQIHCYDYILKPFTNKKISSMFKKIIGNYLADYETNEKKIVINLKSGNLIIDANEILYIEYNSRTIKIVTGDDVVLNKGISLRKFMEKLPNYFIQTHQSFVVNFNYVTNVNIKDAVIKIRGNDDFIPIGRSYKQEMSVKINEFDRNIYSFNI